MLPPSSSGGLGLPTWWKIPSPPVLSRPSTSLDRATSVASWLQNRMVSFFCFILLNAWWPLSNPPVKMIPAKDISPDMHDFCLQPQNTRSWYSQSPKKRCRRIKKKIFKEKKWGHKMNNFCSLPMPCLDGRAYPYLWYLQYCISIWSRPVVVWISICILDKDGAPSIRWPASNRTLAKTRQPSVLAKHFVQKLNDCQQANNN